MPQILLSVTLTQGVLTLSLIIWHEIFFSRLIWIDRNNVKSYVSRKSMKNRNIIWNFINSCLATQEINSKINYLLTPSTFLQLRNLQDIMRMFIIPIMQFRSLFVIVKISGKEYFWNPSRYFPIISAHKIWCLEQCNAHDFTFNLMIHLFQFQYKFYFVHLSI